MVINHLNIQKIKQLFTFCVTENQQFFGRKGKFLTKKKEPILQLTLIII